MCPKLADGLLTHQSSLCSLGCSKIIAVIAKEIGVFLQKLTDFDCGIGTGAGFDRFGTGATVSYWCWYWFWFCYWCWYVVIIFRGNADLQAFPRWGRRSALARDLLRRSLARLEIARPGILDPGLG